MRRSPFPGSSFVRSAVALNINLLQASPLLALVNTAAALLQQLNFGLMHRHVQSFAFSSHSEAEFSELLFQFDACSYYL